MGVSSEWSTSELPLVWGDKKFRHGPPKSCDRRVPDSAGYRALSDTDRKGKGRSGSRAGACLLGTRTTARDNWEGLRDWGGKYRDKLGTRCV